MSVPNWLNKEFIQKCLCSSRCDPQLSVVKCNISNGCNTKKCYTSGLFRLKLWLQKGLTEEETLSLILKCSKKGNAILNLMDESFRTEMYMFANILPKVEMLLTAAGYSDNFYPTCIYSGEEPVNFLMLEDLAESSYELSRAQGGLDLQHSLLVVKTIAKYHAATAAILQKDPTHSAHLKEPNNFAEPMEKTFSYYLPQAAKSVAKCALEWSDFPADLLHRLNNFNGVIIGKVRELAVYRKNKFNVILHGDCWNNNYMFKYNQNKVESVKIIDFQASFVSSPVFDLMFFMYSSFTHDDLDKCIDLLICEYHKQLSQTLELLDYGGITYTLGDLKDDMKEYVAVGAFAAIYVLPWVLTTESDEIDMNKVFEDSHEIQRLYNNAFLDKTFRFKLANIIENGLL